MKTKRTRLSERSLPDYTKGEEIFNMVSHIVGGAFGIAALVGCVLVAALNGNVSGVVSGAIYGASMIILYTMSSVYHGLRNGTAKKVFQIIDHCSIFFLIAGTYTPITIGLLCKSSPAFGWTIFGIIWGCAALGITMTAIDLKKYKVPGMVLYIVMGWCVVIAIFPLLKVMPLSGFMWLLAGGIFYTVGAVLYAVGKRKRYFHSVFHLFVVVGSILQFITIIFYIMP